MVVSLGIGFLPVRYTFRVKWQLFSGLQLGLSLTLSTLWAVFEPKGEMNKNQSAYMAYQLP